MDARHVGSTAETHLNDLQAEMEAGSRQITELHHQAAEIRESLFTNHLEQAALMGSLVKRIADLRASVGQQRDTMRELRHDVRRLRALLQKSP